MNIQQFNYILTLVKFKHFEAAADACFVAQSTLSTMINKFEDEIGIKIFNRKTKPVSVTAEGVQIINRLHIIQKEIEKDFLDKVAEISANMKPADPLDPSSFAGAIVNSEQLEKINKYVNIGKKEGAEIKVGGNITMKDTGGCYFEPTIFKNVENNMQIAQEEIFGPVLTALTFKDYNEAISIANDTEYGLAAGVWTKDINKAIKASREIRAGTVYINNYEEGVDSTIPLGGYKQSGIGRDNGYQALENYLQVKSTWIKVS